MIIEQIRGGGSMRGILIGIGAIVAAALAVAVLHVTGILRIGPTPQVEQASAPVANVDQTTADQNKLIARLRDDILQAQAQAAAQRKIVDALRNASNSAATPEDRAKMVEDAKEKSQSLQTSEVDGVFADEGGKRDWEACKASDGAVDFSTVKTGLSTCYTPAIQGDLEASAKKTSEDYSACLDKLGEAGDNTVADWRRLDDDESAASTAASVAELLKKAKERGDDAYDTCKTAVDEAKDTKQAEKAVSAALTLAANVCFASGANPYVCGGMLIVALLMEEFGTGNGDGNGNGNGNGTGDGTGNGAGAGEGPGQGQGSEPSSPNPLDGGMSPGSFAPPAPPSRPTSITVLGKGGEVHCDVKGAATRSIWVCKLGDVTKNIDLSIAPKGASLAFLQSHYINNNTAIKDDKNGILFCNKLEGVAFADEEKFTAIKLPVTADTKPAIQAPNLETACGALARQ